MTARSKVQNIPPAAVACQAFQRMDMGVAAADQHQIAVDRIGLLHPVLMQRRAAHETPPPRIDSLATWGETRARPP